MSFFNTNNENGNTLEKSISRSNKQDRIIMGIINQELKNGLKLTPRIIWSRTSTPIQLTSVRRSINTLIKNNLISYGPLIRHTCPIDGFTTTERSIIKL